MAIDRSFAGVLAAWVGVLAILMGGHFNVVRCHAAAPDLGDDVAPYATATDSNDPQTRLDQGSIIGWGSQRIDSSVSNAPFIAIAAGLYHSLALKEDGSIVGWGSNAHDEAHGTHWTGQATPPDGNDFIAIAAGGYHSLALKKDGSIVGWGDQATPPAGNDFIAIAAGGSHSLALKKDGSIVGWGDNEDGQATPPDGNDFIAIAAGGSHSLAIRREGPATAP